MADIKQTDSGRLHQAESGINILSEQIALLQLCALGSITAEEMRSLLRMLSSPDKENHVVARETINELWKKAL
jgi:hypothetical protein